MKAVKVSSMWSMSLWTNINLTIGSISEEVRETPLQACWLVLVFIILFSGCDKQTEITLQLSVLKETSAHAAALHSYAEGPLSKVSFCWKWFSRNMLMKVQFPDIACSHPSLMSVQKLLNGTHATTWEYRNYRGLCFKLFGFPGF